MNLNIFHIIENEAKEITFNSSAVLFIFFSFGNHVFSFKDK